MFHVERKPLYTSHNPSPLSPPEGGEEIWDGLIVTCVKYKTNPVDYPNRASFVSRETLIL